ncbi:hypothetical protein SDC9_83500 [bioreactor metagenome]|uniref:ABC-three component systems C-terminal domain-containing protein n=1 Tax=bioreactor metagenome TaxID=1076179 RepID=A0A644Z7S0_9ZZZZ|nr:ABC-three component system protein [Rikenellaceae bacterium]
MTTTNFSAQEPSLGYYYQIRFSLYLLLKNKEMINPSITIENLDDIVIEHEDKVDLFQTKLHINSVANLTDSSSDFWKTIRVWSENITNMMIDANNTIFTLITTAKISESSFLLQLKPDSERDNEDVKNRMLSCVATSQNETNKKSYEAFSALSNENKIALIKNIIILDSSLSIDEALEAIKNQLIYSAPIGKLDSFVEHLEGWWFQQCIEMLNNKLDSISSKQLSQKISDIRDTFQLDNLPDDFADPLNIDESELPDYEDRIFVKQLKIISIRSNGLRSAISDFRRAFEQRSKWLREDLTSLEEIDFFEKQLFDNWNNIFMALKDDCEDVSQEEMIILGKNFYQKFYVERVPQVRIRPKFSSEYLTRGSCHMLSDKLKIGWHPDYQNLIKEKDA